MAAALRFMATVYPNESENVSHFEITGRLWPDIDAREFGVQLGVGQLAAHSTDLANAYCYGSFTFFQTGLYEYYASGKCVSDSENAAVERAIDNHLEWSRKDIGRELARRGAEFGPDAHERVRQRIPPRYLLEDLANAALELQSVEFDEPMRDENGRILAQVSHRVDWIATYGLVGKPHIRVIALLEPFRGSLKSFLVARDE